jgi:hypothetical protein
MYIKCFYIYKHNKSINNFSKILLSSYHIFIIIKIIIFDLKIPLDQGIDTVPESKQLQLTL